MIEGVAQRALRFMALADAVAAQERGSERNCLNRCYYAAFYAASGLLTIKGLHSSKHRGVLSLFDRELVLSGEMSREHGRALHRLFELRSHADYDIHDSFSGEDATEAVRSAECLVHDARAELERALGD